MTHPGLPLPRASRLALASALSFALAGCASLAGPFARPAVDLPAGWQGANATGATRPEQTWWQRFGSSELDTLIQRAQSANFDLRAAAARVAQARAGARIASSALWPNVFATAAAEHAKSPGASSNKRFEAALGAAYELDVWGRNRASAEAADWSVVASAYDEQVVRLTLTADVAATYFQILALNDRLRVAEENLALSRNLLDLVEAQQRAGRMSALEVERQRALVAGAEAAIPPLVQERRVAQNALAVLLGGHGANTPLPSASLRPVQLPAIGAGLPADLLTRRPDIQRAEAALKAAHADVGAARAALFPRLLLSASAGSRSSSLSRLFGAGSGFHALGLDLLQTIFDGGRRAGEIEFFTSRREELVATYQQSIVTALRDVEDALVGIEQSAAQEAALTRAAEAARAAYRLAEARFRAGSNDFTTVLDAQRTLINAEGALDPVRLARAGSTVALYRALGGGWEAPITNASR